MLSGRLYLVLTHHEDLDLLQKRNSLLLITLKALQRGLRELLTADLNPCLQNQHPLFDSRHMSTLC